MQAGFNVSAPVLHKYLVAILLLSLFDCSPHPSPLPGQAMFPSPAGWPSSHSAQLAGTYCTHPWYCVSTTIHIQPIDRLGTLHLAPWGKKVEHHIFNHLQIWAMSKLISHDTLEQALYPLDVNVQGCFSYTVLEFISCTTLCCQV